MLFLPESFLVFIVTHYFILAYVILKAFVICYHWFFPKSPSSGDCFETCLTWSLPLFFPCFIYLSKIFYYGSFQRVYILRKRLV